MISLKRLLSSQLMMFCVRSYLECLATTHSNLLTLFNIGTSVEGRSLKVVKVSSGGSGKKAIFIGDWAPVCPRWSKLTWTFQMEEFTLGSGSHPPPSPGSWGTSWSTRRTTPTFSASSTSTCCLCWTLTGTSTAGALTDCGVRTDLTRSEAGVPVLTSTGTSATSGAAGAAAARRAARSSGGRDHSVSRSRPPSLRWGPFPSPLTLRD